MSETLLTNLIYICVFINVITFIPMIHITHEEPQACYRSKHTQRLWLFVTITCGSTSLIGIILVIIWFKLGYH